MFLVNIARGTLSAIAVAVMLTGCGEPTLDATSDQSFKASVEKIASTLPPDQQGQFKRDLMALALQRLDPSALARGETSDSIRMAFNGKTAAEVMSEAARIRAERAQREREQAVAEINELLQQKAAAEAAKIELAKLQVTKSRFYLKSERQSILSQPIIELSVTNGTGHPVSRAYFKGTIASPGRSIPWIVENFNFEISGGLEPGESQSWVLEPNMFSKWGKVNAPADAIFTVETYRLDGADKKALFDAEGLNESQEARLKFLQEKFGS